jgi:hypothetical protein
MQITRTAVVCLLFGVVTLSNVASAQPLLILHDFYAGPEPNPSFIRDNLAYLETLPIDGVSVYVRDPHWVTNVSGSIFAPIAMSYDAISSVLTPMATLNSARLKHNFGLMFAGPGIDAFDDAGWAVRVQNMGNFAAALKSANFEGILFDNENYLDWSHYGGKGCSASHTLIECQDQMRLRGQQVMSAMVSRYPEITIICLNGPWISDNTFYDRSGLDNIANANELSGPFFVGLVEGNGSSSTVVDGGEFYRSATVADFEARYQDQKYGVASDIGALDDSKSRAAGPNGFIPTDMRPQWGSKIIASAGVFDKASGMDPSVFQTTLTNALNRVERYAWVYTEKVTFLQPPGSYPSAASADWVTALRNARAAGTGFVQTSHAPSGTTYLSSWQEIYSSNGFGPIEKDTSNGEVEKGDGKTITIRGATFAHGLGVHASSEIRYTLGGTCKTFSATIGVDDEVWRDGTLLFQVSADGIQLYGSDVLTRSSAAVPISVDITGKNELRLVVLDGGGGGPYDHGDWADAKVTCQ